MSDKMFCFQCQETAGGNGCTVRGVCGKTADVAAMQDLLIYATKGLSAITTKLREEGTEVPLYVNHMVNENLFSTITNANFDIDDIEMRISDTLALSSHLISKVRESSKLPDESFWHGRFCDFASKASDASVLSDEDEDIRSLKALITYGLKGMAAYLTHAASLEYDDPEIDSFLQGTMAKLLSNALTVSELLILVDETGRYGISAMKLLDEANTGAFGAKEISHVRLDAGSRPSILVSGHDFHILEELLMQTAGLGIDVYTHSEMLPAHYYPKLKRYCHLFANYGGAWYEQAKDFEAFNGPILMTTNCIVPPSASYKDRLYTAGTAGYPGCTHIWPDQDGEYDFTEIIEHAKKCPPPEMLERGNLTGGFGHQQIASLASTLAEAIRINRIRQIVVMAGCDGRMKSREYYTEYAASLGDDTFILTAGCAKYRYIKNNDMMILGLPRVLDAGQCNDSYSIVLGAVALKEELGLSDINDLPIVYNIAWYEQKAVLVLLSLLHLGIRGIRLGPTLPAFASPQVLDILKKEYGLTTISTVEEDLLRDEAKKL